MSTASSIKGKQLPAHSILIKIYSAIMWFLCDSTALVVSSLWLSSISTLKVFSRLYFVQSCLCYSVAYNHLSVFLPVANVFIVAKWCLLEQKLQLIAYRKSVGTKMNDLDLGLEVVLRS